MKSVERGENRLVCWGVLDDDVEVVLEFRFVTVVGNKSLYVRFKVKAVFLFDNIE